MSRAEPNRDSPNILVTVLMPCLNEARTLAACIQQAHAGCQAALIQDQPCRVSPSADSLEHTYEILIADNGSSDGSPEIAIANGARVVHVEEKGYGAALRGGIAAARGKYVVMGDSDCSYDFGEVARLLNRLEEGYDLVVGNRFVGGIQPGAMPWTHRYVGNPILSGIGRLLYGTPIRDWHCGIRGFDKDKIIALNLHCPGMEFASEMLIMACKSGLKMSEIPTKLHPDKRDRKPHMRSVRDGLRHLTLLLGQFSWKKPVSKLRNYFFALAVMFAGVVLSYPCRNHIRAIFGGPVISLDAMTKSEHKIQLILQNVSLSRVTVVGAKASCSCLLNVDYPFSIAPFSSAIVEIDSPPPGSQIEFYVNTKSGPIGWKF